MQNKVRFILSCQVKVLKIKKKGVFLDYVVNGLQFNIFSVWIGFRFVQICT